MVHRAVEEGHERFAELLREVYEPVCHLIKYSTIFHTSTVMISYISGWTRKKCSGKSSVLNVAIL